MPAVTVVTRVEKRGVPTAPARPTLYMHLEDQAVFGRLRTCAQNGSSCPAVFVLRTPSLKTVIDQQQQYFLAGINYGMDPGDVATELHYRLAFANYTGLGRPDLPRRNYLAGKDLTAKENPRFDKDRTCTRSVMTGVEGYSLATALIETVQAAANTLMRRNSFLAFRQSIRTLLTANNVLIVQVLDGNKPPPLKPSRSYPARVQDINPDDYLYTPWTHRWLFFAANTVGSASGGSKIYPFPRGATYDWTGDGWKYTWFPHISREEIRYPLSRLRKLRPDEPIPSPYRA